MPTYMGNVGHLMQHWTLCTLLTIASDEDKHIPGLHFIDAHAMAPLASVMRSRRPDEQFDAVRDGLPGQESVYEWAWHHLAPNVGYPNSAVFVEKVWRRDFALLLCETDWPTIAELAQWYDSVGRLRRCRTAELSPGDWRNRFERPLPNPAEVGLPDGSLTLVSFDPDWYDNTTTFVDQGNGRKLYPDDIEQTLTALERVQGGVIVQLSTYSTGARERRGPVAPQDQVIQSVDDSLGAGDFNRCCEPVRVNDRMMSLVYARNVSWAAKLENLPARFTDWLLAIRGG